MKFDTANPDRLTDRAKGVLVEAEAVAMRRGAFEIAPEDLLLAIARRDCGVGRRILEGLSIKLDELQEDLANLAPRHETPACRPAALGLSAEALHVLAWAKKRRRHSTTDTSERNILSSGYSATPPRKQASSCASAQAHVSAPARFCARFSTATRAVSKGFSGRS